MNYIYLSVKCVAVCTCVMSARYLQVRQPKHSNKEVVLDFVKSRDVSQGIVKKIIARLLQVRGITHNIIHVHVITRDNAYIIHVHVIVYRVGVQNLQ